MKANGVVECTVVGSVLTFSVGGTEPFSIDVDALPANTQQDAKIHGVRQKVSDGAALSRDPRTGRPATPAEKRARMVAIAEGLRRGEWRRKGTGGGGRMTDKAILAIVLAEKFPGKTEVEISDYIAAKSRAQITALLNSDALREIVARVRGAGDVDGDELLAELEN